MKGLVCPSAMVIVAGRDVVSVDCAEVLELAHRAAQGHRRAVVETIIECGVAAPSRAVVQIVALIPFDEDRNVVRVLIPRQFDVVDAAAEYKSDVGIERGPASF